MPTREQSAFIAALEGAALGLAVVAAGMLTLWWMFV
jgi:hypothetical protein